MKEINFEKWTELSGVSYNKASGKYLFENEEYTQDELVSLYNKRRARYG